MIDKMELSNKASFLRRQLGQDELAPLDIFHLAQTIEKLTLIFYPLDKNISGICYKSESSNVIVINSDMSIGRQRFSLAHEFYHLYFDESGVSSVSLTSIGKGDEVEKKADQFASYFLMPQLSLYRCVEEMKNNKKRKCLTMEDMIKLEQYYGVSHKAMLYRLLEERQIDLEQANALEMGVIEIASKLGYDTTLYYPSVKEKKRLVLGHYIAMSEKLLKEDRISQGKYEELLLDAFREDIVYGISDEEEVPID